MEFLQRRRSLVEDRLTEVVSAVDPAELSAEMEHVALAGGKRVRPMVTILACEAAGGEPEDAVEFGVGVELVHNASLVIDDIIDRSEVRRGTDSAWFAFGHGPAIVASDGLLGEAFAQFANDGQATEVVTAAMVELGEGEATELQAIPDGEAEYLELARRKTGALFRAAAELGAIAADADQEAIDAFGEYAERVGVAFQIRDDVLDATAAADDLGKPTGQDAAMDRPSIVHVTDLDPEAANDRAREEADLALAALDRVELENDTAEGYLRDLAEFVVVRER
ncbi:multifunctional long-chain (E)-prenyl diphosphate synthase [Salinarchaeum sp. Harcht-Bsk1]|uniref:polyprenyl synthetase family protein n=1 Tax=Salinarchaeum sp. Harcht-Bsk1 TaxID=1333523 RepID=UPI0003423AAE|nr:polyprenyl synthetase family protein [Salinarchaeum sp. Harcht-Bsk1]AGN00323.1 multifunctional long-chain (E)-prenyl diphosphate synthase [Salinarchaeum sp. Harcht-Bsk1]